MIAYRRAMLRLGSEIAQAEEAGAYVTGAIVPVDGGMATCL